MPSKPSENMAIGGEDSIQASNLKDVCEDQCLESTSTKKLFNNLNEMSDPIEQTHSVLISSDDNLFAMLSEERNILNLKADDQAKEQDSKQEEMPQEMSLTEVEELDLKEQTSNDLQLTSQFADSEVMNESVLQTDWEQEQPTDNSLAASKLKEEDLDFTSSKEIIRTTQVVLYEMEKLFLESAKKVAIEKESSRLFAIEADFVLMSIEKDQIATNKILDAPIWSDDIVSDAAESPMESIAQDNGKSVTEETDHIMEDIVDSVKVLEEVLQLKPIGSKSSIQLCETFDGESDVLSGGSSQENSSLDYENPWSFTEQMSIYEALELPGLQNNGENMETSDINCNDRPTIWNLLLDLTNLQYDALSSQKLYELGRNVLSMVITGTYAQSAQQHVKEVVRSLCAGASAGHDIVEDRTDAAHPPLVYLYELYLKHLRFDETIAASLAQVAPQLKVLRMKSVEMDDSLVAEFLEKCMSLEMLTITGSHTLSGKCLEKLVPEKLKSLHVEMQPTWTFDLSSFGSIYKHVLVMGYDMEKSRVTIHPSHSDWNRYSLDYSHKTHEKAEEYESENEPQGL